MADEIELKLSVPAGAFPKVRAHAAIAAAARGRLRTRRIESTYYDTPDRELAAAGVALRVRHVGARWLQTVKGEGNVVAGVHRRAEYEWRLAAPRLDIAKLAQTPWRKLFARATTFRRVFVTTVRRSELPLAFADGTRATLCFDSGEIRAGRRCAPISEIEVELEQGDPQRLFELAAALAADLPVRVLRASKAERGHALAGAAPPKPRRARDVELTAEATPQAALAAIASECIVQVEANAEGMLAHDDAEYLHQLRVGWRRLRSLLSSRRPSAPRSGSRRIDEELRWLGSTPRPGARQRRIRRGDAAGGRRRIPRQPGIAALRARPRGDSSDGYPAPARDASPRRVSSCCCSRLGAFFATPDAPCRGAVCRHRRATGSLRCCSSGTTDCCDGRGISIASPPPIGTGRASPRRNALCRRILCPVVFSKHRAAYIAALSKLQSILGRLNDLEIAGKLLDEIAPAEDALRRRRLRVGCRARLACRPRRAAAQAPARGTAAVCQVRAILDCVTGRAVLESAEIGHRVAKQVYLREEPKLREALLNAQYDLAQSGRGPVLLILSGVEVRRPRRDRQQADRMDGPAAHPRDCVRAAPPGRSRATAGVALLVQLCRPRGRIGIFMDAWYEEAMATRGPRQDRPRRGTCAPAADPRARADADRRGFRAAQVLDPSVQGGTEGEAAGAREPTRARHGGSRARIGRPTASITARTTGGRCLLRQTSTGFAPWYVVEGVDAHYRYLTVGKILLDALRATLAPQRCAAAMRVTPPRARGDRQPQADPRA